MKFKAEIRAFEENSLMWSAHIIIPEDIYRKMLFKAPDKRILAIFNQDYEQYCAMLPKGDMHYILVSKQALKKMNAQRGDQVTVELKTQDLKYGVPICEELEQILAYDDQASLLFHGLTPGMQRSLILMIGKYKNIQLRIDRSLILMEHIKLRHGKIDNKILLDQFRRG